MTAEILTHRSGRIQEQQSCGVVTDAKFPCRAQHAMGLNAAHLAAPDLQAAGKLGADQGTGHLGVRHGIRRAADDLQQIAGANSHPAQTQPIGVRMGVGADDLRDDDAAEGRSDAFFLFHLKAGHRQKVRELLTMTCGVYETA